MLSGRPAFYGCGRLKEVITLSPQPEESVMPLSGIFDPEQLAMLSEVLDDYCTECGIERASPDHEYAGYRLMSLFESGSRTAEELKSALSAALTDSGRLQA
jgi:hypothetical protein